MTKAAPPRPPIFPVAPFLGAQIPGATLPGAGIPSTPSLGAQSPSLTWLWWWAAAQVAGAAVALRGRLTGQPPDGRLTTEPLGAVSGRFAPPSAGWTALVLAGLAAYGAGLLMGLLLRMQVV